MSQLFKTYYIDRYLVSTIFNVINYEYETLIFDEVERHDIYIKAYTDRAGAISGHQAAINWLLKHHEGEKQDANVK